MGFRDFIKKLAYQVKEKLIDPDNKQAVAELQAQCGLRKKNQGGLGRFASPRRIPSEKSVARFWSRFTPKGIQVLAMRMKNVQQKQPAVRRATRKATEATRAIQQEEQLEVAT
jgi:hypothetical protein